jgi:hypothetical protein
MISQCGVKIEPVPSFSSVELHGLGFIRQKTLLCRISAAFRAPVARRPQEMDSKFSIWGVNSPIAP